MSEDTQLVQIAILKTRMDEFEKKMDERFDRLEGTITAFIDNSERKFSAKWVEDAVKYVVVTIIGLVIAAVAKLIFFTTK